MLALLTFAIVLVDQRWLRTAIAFVPALLIVQRALTRSRHTEARQEGGSVERRLDGAARSYIDDLLGHFREFYSTCHLMANGLIEPEDAERRAGALEKELNQLLAKVMDEAKRGEPI